MTRQSPLNEESPLDDSWLAISQDWQEQPYEKANLDALVRKTRRRTWWAKACLVANILATAGMLVTLLVGLYRGDWETPHLVTLAVLFVSSVVYVYIEIKIRSAAWQLNDAGPDHALKAAISGGKSSLQYARLMKWSFYFLIIPLNWYAYAMMEFREKITWKTFAFINVFLLVMYICTHIYQKKRERELASLKQFSENN
ncbi:hypothetical protein SG34_005955 [Thalassomonas viridans]|uniref:Uncharacterized protein n=1 Tax=Thalassomonas viridans TaxID=137584 RepID=A0AAF0CA39_9GAMM|nr:hypothetical protein [Thalassomonas viridans]WDE06463.1 hypothetical protein SG34_005955 [Thalassomonas viridans]